jgi:hypothetical protein
MKDPGALERGNRQSNLVDEHHFVPARVEEVVRKPAPAGRPSASQRDMVVPSPFRRAPSRA